MPSSVEIIGKFSFSNCKNLASIHLTNVKNIKDSALENCTALITIDMPKVEIIDDQAFYNCKSLKELTLPSTIKIIGEAFSFTKINKINYLGTIEQYCKIVLPNNSYPLDNIHKAKLYFNNELVGPHLNDPRRHHQTLSKRFFKSIQHLISLLTFNINRYRQHSF